MWKIGKKLPEEPNFLRSKSLEYLLYMKRKKLVVSVCISSNKLDLLHSHHTHHLQ